MSRSNQEVHDAIEKSYQHGFTTDIEAESLPPGLDEGVVRWISAKKKEPAFLLEWRLKAFRHWQTLSAPQWSHTNISPIDFQAISYFSAPKSAADRPQSLDEVDPKLLETYKKL